MSNWEKKMQQQADRTATTPKSIKEQLPEGLLQTVQAVIDHNNPEEIISFFEKEFPGITPTTKEFFDGQLYAYEQAATRLKKAEEEKKKQERISELRRMWTPEEMYKRAFETGKAIGIQQGFDFIIDEYNEEVFKILCLYFTNDKRFEEYGIGDRKYSLQKGIWLQSPTKGTGKSIMLRCFWINKRNCFGYKHTTELATMFQKNAFEGIDKFIDVMEQPLSAMTFYQGQCGFMYDELFGERHVNHMGSPLVISEYIINKLYDFSDNKKDQKWKFHCTSNMDGQDIETKSGETFRSRMVDMFNLIKLEGPPRR